MSEFRFRAAAALEVRRGEEDVAARALALAEGRFSEGSRAVSAADASRTLAQVKAAEQAKVGVEIATLEWHRNWIIHWSVVVGRLRQELDGLATAMGEARVAWQAARRRRLSLERMRERAWQRFRYEEHRQDIKAMDELARIRYVLDQFGGTPRD